MWDSNSPLQLLKTMPSVLEEEHLNKLQLLLDADKYKNQLISGANQCGVYAPFCEICDKAQTYPCAVAYVKLMQAAGLDVRLAGDAAKNVADAASEAADEQVLEETAEENAEESTAVAAVEAPEQEAEQPSEEPKEVSEQEPEENRENNPPATKGKIRIAIVRKRTL